MEKWLTSCFKLQTNRRAVPELTLDVFKGPSMIE